MKNFLLILVATLFVSCATVPKTIPLTETGKTLTIASSITTDMSLVHVAITIFGNEYKNIDASDIAIGEAVKSKLKRALEKNDRFEVNYYQAEDEEEKISDINLYSKVTIWKMNEQKEYIKSIASKTNSDLVLVVGTFNSSDRVFGTNQTFTNYGIFQRSSLASTKGVNFSSLKVLLFDGKTGDEISGTSKFQHAPRPAERAGEKLNFTGDELLRTKQEIKVMFSTLLDELLVEMGL